MTTRDQGVMRLTDKSRKLEIKQEKLSREISKKSGDKKPEPRQRKPEEIGYWRVRTIPEQ